MKRDRGGPLTYALLILASAVAVFPPLWALATSLKPSAVIFAVPPQWIPWPPTLEHYETVIAGSGMGRYFFNTLVVTVLCILATTLLAVHAAYGSVRFRFRGRDTLLFALLATSMIPGIALLAPLYALSTQFGLYDTRLALVLAYAAWQTPTAIWLMRGFIENLPKEIDDAASVDGCSKYQAFRLIVVPLVKPGLAAGAVLIFVNVWNDFLFATALTLSEDVRTLQVGLYRYLGDVGVEWGRLTAYTILSILPIVAVFVWLQRRFIEGLSAGAVKG
jgi:ABC-type glycerol-3-phosphate transport system permease component